MSLCECFTGIACSFVDSCLSPLIFRESRCVYSEWIMILRSTLKSSSRSTSLSMLSYPTLGEMTRSRFKRWKMNREKKSKAMLRFTIVPKGQENTASNIYGLTHVVRAFIPKFRPRLTFFICIDKRSSAELTEAINSMFKWYQRAARCYVYLVDVPEVNMARSRWFTRGWTLQVWHQSLSTAIARLMRVFLGTHCTSKSRFLRQALDTHRD